MKFIVRILKPVTVLLAIVLSLAKTVGNVLCSAGKSLRRLLENIVSIFGLFIIGMVVAALGAAIGWAISFPIVGLVLINGAAPYLATLGIESIPDLMAGVASAGSVVATFIVTNKEDWSRSLKAGCLAFALAFSIHVLPDTDTGQRIVACPSGQSVLQREINISLDNYDIAPRLRAPAGYVFLIHDSDHSKLYKFGYTTDISTRIASINKQMPGDVTLVALLQVEFAAEQERRLRHKFTENEELGEWFDLTYEQLREICSL